MFGGPGRIPTTSQGAYCSQTVLELRDLTARGISDEPILVDSQYAQMMLPGFIDLCKAVARRGWGGVVFCTESVGNRFMCADSGGEYEALQKALLVEGVVVPHCDHKFMVAWGTDICVQKRGSPPKYAEQWMVSERLPPWKDLCLQARTYFQELAAREFAAKEAGF